MEPLQASEATREGPWTSHHPWIKDEAGLNIEGWRSSRHPGCRSKC